MKELGLDAAVDTLFAKNYRAVVIKVDRIFAWLLWAQWALAVLFAVLLSPRAWEGAESSLHIHVYAALVMGGVLTLFPIWQIRRSPGAEINRWLVTFAQMMYSVLFIHLTGGRIETHFHVFGSIAFVAYYRDWRLVIFATVITGLDHFLRGFFWPESVYGVLTASPWRALEHSAWVAFEDVVLLFGVRTSITELRLLSRRQVELQRALANVEEAVVQRTLELRESQRVVLEQEQALVNRAKFSALGEMAAGVAHEINNPLAVIMTISSQIEELADGPELDRAGAKRLGATLVRTSERIAKIVQGLRTFSRDGTHDPMEAMNVAEVVEETVSLCQERFRNRGVAVTVEPIDPRLVVEARSTQISQVLLNLLNNSSDAIAELGEKWIRISAVASGEEVQLRVVDSGPGVPAALAEKIFQPFFTTKEVGKGTGLGLSISLGIMRAHKGNLRVDPSAENTTFIMTLPKK